MAFDLNAAGTGEAVQRVGGGQGEGVGSKAGVRMGEHAHLTRGEWGQGGEGGVVWTLLMHSHLSSALLGWML